SGAFGKPDEFGTLPRGAGETDISHQRLVMYARAAKMWIITDRLRSTGSHQYAQQWLIPIRPSGIFKASDLRIGLGFDPSKITLDEPAKTIATHEPLAPQKVGGKIEEAPKANLSLYQFSAMPLQYSAQPKRNPHMDGLIIYHDWDRVQATWRGTGDQQVVTLVLPRVPGTGAEGDLKNSKQITSGKNGIGFEAVTPDNKTVKYLSSITPDDVLTLDNVTVHGGALLLEGNHGMALGVSKMTINGTDIPISTPDFEFQLNGNSTPQFTPIYRPIAPVEIGPQSDVFAGKVLISLSCNTPGVNIHYTLDGSDPTPQSPLYTHPVTLTQTATVLARAYRPGVTKNPPQLSGTEATVVSAAYFKKVDLAPAVHSPRTSSGLDVNYYEADWKKLFFDFENQKPIRSGHVSKLWDTSIIPRSNPIVGKNDGSHVKSYVLEYQGFLNIPADGVYTFRAPQEYVWPATAAGYDLRVWVDGKLWYPSTWLHAFGTWSAALQKGSHRFRAVFIDYRSGAAAKLNRTGFNPYIWPGTTPDLKISGADLKEQLIPAAWLSR
ncbi:MAG: chitobiase/beta-hexosaminidase C-terminal domain-containing protein, partial [Abditibacteriaceae bacterium]